MSILPDKVLKVFYHYDVPDSYVLFQIEGRFFVNYMRDNGFMGGERTDEIMEDDFIGLSQDPNLLEEIVRKYDRDRTMFVNPPLEGFSFVRSTEPYILYKLSNRSFIALWTGQRTGEQIAIEISKENFDRLFNKEVLPSEVLN